MSIGNGAPAWPSVTVSNGGISPSDHNVYSGVKSGGTLTQRTQNAAVNDAHMPYMGASSVRQRDFRAWIRDVDLCYGYLHHPSRPQGDG